MMVLKVIAVFRVLIYIANVHVLRCVETMIKYASNCTILTVSPPIYAIGKKKPEKNSGLQRDSNT